MARWKLVSSHYLTVQGTFWEQVEVDQMTGKQVRKRYDVPLQLDIADTSLWNDNIIRNPRGEILGGDIVVAYADMEHKSSDYLFKGQPTPDMFPLDDEARAISEKYVEGWKAAPSEEVSYGRKLIERMEEHQANVDAKAQNVKIEGLDEILRSMAAMMEQNSALIATLASVNKPAVERRA